MKNVLLFLSVFLLCQIASAFDGYHRYFNIDVLHYEFALGINDTTDEIAGRTVIDLIILEKSDSVIFDLKGLNNQGKGMTVKDVTLAGKDIRWKQGNDRLILLPDHSEEAHDTIEFVIEYSGIPADGLIISRNKYGDRTFFADHWPDRAHNYLPCIDHPYDKATVDFIITAPEQNSVVANGNMTEESSLSGNMKLTHWSEAVPLPVKVMTFGAARFAVKFAGMADNIPVWSWVFPQNRTEGFNDYAIAVKPMEFYERLIGHYPFEKLANVQSRTIYGGLENAGAIFYAENSVTGLGRAERLIAHEVAHQWFGDCVSEADWHHIWLSEGFATYLTSVYVESTQGKQKLASEMAHSREVVIKFFEKKASPVIDTTITNLMDLLSINSYQKGAWVLHMLRNETGDENFINGLRLFFTRFHDRNAVSSDFQKAMEETSGKDLGTFFKQWLYFAGQPELKIWKKENSRTGRTEIYIEQKQDKLFEFNLDLLIKNNSGDRIEKVSVKDRITKISLPQTNVSNVIPDPGVKLLFKLVD